MAQLEGEYQHALALYTESLSLRWALRNTAGCAWCLEGLAQIAGALGHTVRAARLWGAAEALRTRIGASLSPAERSRHDGCVAATRARLDAATFEAAWAEGQAMTLEQAIAYALEGSDIDSVALIGTAASKL